MWTLVVRKELDLGDEDMDMDLDLGDEDMDLAETSTHKGEQDTHEMWANLAKIAGARSNDCRC